MPWKGCGIAIDPEKALRPKPHKKTYATRSGHTKNEGESHPKEDHTLKNCRKAERESPANRPKEVQGRGRNPIDVVTQEMKRSGDTAASSPVVPTYLTKYDRGWGQVVLSQRMHRPELRGTAHDDDSASDPLRTPESLVPGKLLKSILIPF